VTSRGMNQYDIWFGGGRQAANVAFFGRYEGPKSPRCCVYATKLGDARGEQYLLRRQMPTEKLKLPKSKTWIQRTTFVLEDVRPLSG